MQDQFYDKTHDESQMEGLERDMVAYDELNRIIRLR